MPCLYPYQVTYIVLLLPVYEATTSLVILKSCTIYFKASFPKQHFTSPRYNLIQVFLSISSCLTLSIPIFLVQYRHHNSFQSISHAANCTLFHFFVSFVYLGPYQVSFVLFTHLPDPINSFLQQDGHWFPINHESTQDGTTAG